ncbi:hypothetical protein RGU12_11750 [Fredinandcohnia sp. QZ13]|uniref:hypothetical protein n=1 Tax=Fredinandcohnia sp. QZ13 TaxID=3073144 RepID=UPI0028536113|nr:hypothetical protein [Fredinandcohnia sp. QZ13]MDR4888225.1 hypothetical protein [Fredinandcohnia sp. QZ13]
MEEQKNGFIQWVKANKKELIIAGVSISAIISIIVGIKNKDRIMALWESLIKSIENSPVKVQTSSREVVESITHEPAQVVEVVSATEIIRFPSNDKTQVPFDVCDHIRNLPDGWHASAKKITTAAEYGYNLKPGQTWVDTYTKGVSIA